MKNSTKALTLLILVLLAFGVFYAAFYDKKPAFVQDMAQEKESGPTDKTLGFFQSCSPADSCSVKNGDNVVERHSEAYSPLSVYPGFRDNESGGREKDREQQMLEEQQREQMVAECMKNRGFKYTPAQTVVIRHDDDYTTQELLDMLEQPDPDDEYLSQLSEAERLAYNLALYGIPDPNAEDAEAYENVDPNACWSIANRKIPGIYSIAGGLAEERRALDKAIASDKKIEDAVRAWSRCMEAKGFQYESPNAIKTAIGDLEISLRNEDPNKARQQIIAAFDPIMTAGKSCDQEVGLSYITKKVIYEREQAFVDEHRDLLEKSGSKGGSKGSE